MFAASHGRWRNIGDGLILALLPLFLLWHIVLLESAPRRTTPGVLPIEKPAAAPVMPAPIALVEMQLPLPQANEMPPLNGPEHKLSKVLQPPPLRDVLPAGTKNAASTQQKITIKPLPANVKIPAEQATLSPLKHRIVDIQTPRSQQQGQQLLRQLEQGKGPGIEIAWPVSRRGREGLFNLLHDCLGLRVAKLHRGQLSAVEESSAALGGQKMSRFVRLVVGSISAREQTLLTRLHANGVAVRLFPRQVDASMLAGLASLVGGNYAHSQQIRGHYRRQGSALLIENIAVDGRAIAGVVRLAGASCGKFAFPPQNPENTP